MLLEPHAAIEEGDIESVSFDISSHRRSEEEMGFGLKEFEPTPMLDAIVVGRSEVTPTGACCIGPACSILTETECINAGGTYQGNNTGCDPNPCGECSCVKVVSISVTFSVDDTESAGCDFHATRTETLVSGETVDLCGAAWGPFEFIYPEYDNGQIFIGTLAVGLSGPDPAPICFFTDGICGVFYHEGCGSGYACFQVNDEWYTGDDPCFTVCNPPGTITLSWVEDDGMGFAISATVTITISDV